MAQLQVLVNGAWDQGGSTYMGKLHPRCPKVKDVAFCSDQILLGIQPLALTTFPSPTLVTFTLMLQNTNSDIPLGTYDLSLPPPPAPFDFFTVATSDTWAIRATTTAIPRPPLASFQLTLLIASPQVAAANQLTTAGSNMDVACSPCEKRKCDPCCT